MSLVPQLLVVDDDDVLRYSLLRSLQRFDFDLFEAASVQTAKKIIKHQNELNQPINRVILDLRLSNESGFELAQWMLKFDENIKIVIITGYASITTAVEAIKLGVSNYLIKPIGVAEILQAFDTQKSDSTPVIVETPMSPRRLEWEHIQKVLMANDGNVSRAARALKMHRRTLQRKLQKKPVKD